MGDERQSPQEIAEGAFDRLCAFDAIHDPENWETTAKRVEEFLQTFLEIGTERLGAVLRRSAPAPMTAGEHARVIADRFGLSISSDGKISTDAHRVMVYDGMRAVEVDVRDIVVLRVDIQSPGDPGMSASAILRSEQEITPPNMVRTLDPPTGKTYRVAHITALGEWQAEGTIERREPHPAIMRQIRDMMDNPSLEERRRRRDADQYGR